ncbi:MAG: hypothetical protein EZS28_019072 [Streblomastix strix]|uniref:Uncharacterized protein n=1 Tax=Streblomastix strix TaxID=222440 RepID=A0A5J4VS62_9EUKA|nr:MAG: hypothetical protein EZS28_019072 [Streblomastix strix]
MTRSFQTAKFPDPELQNTLKKECALVRCSDFGGVTGKRGEQEEYFTSAQEYGQYAPLKLTPKTFNHKFIPFR